MGTVIHETVIFTGTVNDEGEPLSQLQHYHKKAKFLFGKQVTDIIRHPINGEATFMVVSSGSKMGWQPAIDHNNKIEKLVNAYDVLPAVEILHIAHGEVTPFITQLPTHWNKS